MVEENPVELRRQQENARRRVEEFVRRFKLKEAACSKEVDAAKAAQALAVAERDRLVLERDKAKSDREKMDQLLKRIMSYADKVAKKGTIHIAERKRLRKENEGNPCHSLSFSYLVFDFGKCTVLFLQSLR